ncbi:general secretion pathway protein GspK [Pseudenhygromyxa sp. WMMC2535]|uniref:type II secretion system protein GspK n=1 Tax=Pseudenhygromyxa sp. WMMC2535 TaxID=2712867 RepID=UPI001557FDC7|nr:type II secretion system protein GspK [Pseudenhygromyxa sp. WMMC2535]NVB36718.1 general secretion pathway protein GspK [Pseudenhygromyxa sp. WMMC2535]
MMAQRETQQGTRRERSPKRGARRSQRPRGSKPEARSKRPRGSKRPRKPAPGGKSSRPRKPKARNQQGVAILLVLIALAILFPFTATFNYKARVDWQSAVNHGDEVRARAIQRGAMQLSTLLFELQRMVFNSKQFREMVGAMDITQLAPYLMSIFGTQDGAEGLGALVGLDTSSLNELALDGGGTFEVRLEAESGKINVNCLAVESEGNDTPQARTYETLDALLMPKLYDPLFDEEKSDGNRYPRYEVLRALVDYIDPDTRKFSTYRLANSSQDERYRYQELVDPYEARDARLDSVQELQLVEGIDDDWMAAFAPELTVYGGCKVNINFASAEQIAQVIRHSVRGEDRWKTEGENFLTMTMPLANYVVESREFSLFKKLEDFKELVNDPDKYANPLTMMGEESDADMLANMPKIPDGIVVREIAGTKDGASWGGLRDVATVEPERIYRIEIITTVGSVSKRLTAVYDIQYARSQSQGKGAWLYYRED